MGDEEEKKKRRGVENRAHQFASRDLAAGGVVSGPTMNRE